MENTILYLFTSNSVVGCIKRMHSCVFFSLGMLTFELSLLRNLLPISENHMNVRTSEKKIKTNNKYIGLDAIDCQIQTNYWRWPY